MQKVKTDPDDFLKSLPDGVRQDAIKLDQEISKILKLPRTMWEGVFWGGSQQKIVGYGNFTFVGRTRSVEWFYVGLAVQKNYISLYVNAHEDGKSLAKKYAAKLGKAKIGSSSISFKSLKDIDWQVLVELLKRAKELMVKK